MFKFESTSNCINGHLVFKDILWLVVGRDDDPSWSDGAAASFGLCSEGIVVRPVLEVGAQDSVLLGKVV